MLTHLDFDHAGGLEDFPEATVHVLQAEMDDARGARDGFIASAALPAGAMGRGPGLALLRPGGERWFGFDAVRDLDGLPPEILMIPLPGHTPAMRAWRSTRRSGWLLNAGDAYFYRHEMDAEPACTPGPARLPAPDGGGPAEPRLHNQAPAARRSPTTAARRPRSSAATIRSSSRPWRGGRQRRARPGRPALAESSLGGAAPDLGLIAPPAAL